MEKTLSNEISMLETQIEQSLAYKDTDKALAGCVVSLRQGQLLIVEGVVKSEDAKGLAEQQKTEQAALGDDSDEAGDPSPAEGGFSQALTNDLGAYRSMAIKAELAKNPAVAKDWLLHSLCLDLLETGYHRSPLSVSARTARPESSRDDMAVYPGTTDLAQSRERQSLQWIAIEDERERFTAFVALSENEKSALWAYVVADSFMSGLADRQGGAMDAVMDLLAVPFREHWTPTGDNFFGRIQRSTLDQVATDLCGDEWVAERSSMKKSELAKTVSTLFVSSDNTPVEREDAIGGWLPEGF